MGLKIVEILGIIAIFQSLILSVFFFTHKQGTRVSNRLFAALLFVFAIVVSYSFANSRGVYESTAKYAIPLFVVAQTAFLIAPLLYLYIKSLLESSFSLKKIDLLHGLPFIIATIFVIIYMRNVERVAYTIFSLHTIYTGLLLFAESVYLVLIFRALRKSKVSLRKLFSKTDDNKLSWMRFFTFAFIIIWNVKFQSFVFLNLGQLWDFCPYTESIYFVAMFLLFNTIVFIALKKPELFSTLKKYETSDLSETDKEGYRLILMEYIEKEKPYLDPTLTLPRLSKRLSIHHRYLSQIINESYNKNFNDFINEYRIKESKKMLREENGDKKTMLEIAYYAGFNSKSSFYDAFKKNTGLTPREYKLTTVRRAKISLN